VGEAKMVLSLQMVGGPWKRNVVIIILLFLVPNVSIVMRKEG
jgi:hypothetical protein